jgi:hypothetical protein
MNYRNEPYPENLINVINYANDLATEISKKLNSDTCKKISELYFFEKNRIKRHVNNFDSQGYTPNSFLKNTTKNTDNNEFKGLYIFGEEIEGKITPVYVGISRTIFRRLKQHAWGKKHNECSLAYLKTREKWISEGNNIDRATISNEDMLPAKSIIQNYKVVLWSVPEDYNLYFLEVVLAGKFKTKWNSFRTH